MQATITQDAPTGGLPEFAGFGPEFFAFLRDLERHNDSAWFAGHRPRFEEHVRGPALAFVRAVAPGLALACPPLLASDQKSRGAMLRMNRDTRFSANKRPYHTSVVLRFPHRGTDVRTAPAATLRLTSRQIVLSAGVRPGGAHTLGLIRAAVDTYRETWAGVRADRALRATFGDLVAPELVRVPGGWPSDHPFAADLRRKSFQVAAELPTSTAHDADFVRHAVAAWSAAAPLLRFVSTALGLDWPSGATPGLAAGSGSAALAESETLAESGTSAESETSAESGAEQTVSADRANVRAR